MGLFSSTRNRDRAKWFFVVLLGMTMIQATQHFELIPSLWALLKSTGVGRFLFLV
ncbi:hypothetical protein J0A68_10485 [Algoriphagus sp. H41]|uniref:MFS transporter n=1 Tax=Algoriphagus oliviformis TaxID=2811231 RepID=A0ABS3C2S3_9BACT|nr:hypothetical protein [Algoriphagus oliviformis]MBN7811386.1 hypothetical protein [Algoriphagus oliviformis]